MWEYQGSEFTSEMIGEHYGFVYIIENRYTGQKYVGKKVFFSKRTLPPLKGKKRKRHVKKESDWQKYWSSSDEIKEIIKEHGTDRLKRTIISLHPNKGEINYHELKLQMMLNVLDAVDAHGERAYYNGNINMRHYQSAKFADHRLEQHQKYLTLCSCTN